MSNLLILLTKKFPFSQGQESFLAPELPYLTKEFDKVILISCESGKKDIYMDNTVIDADVIRLKDYNSKMKYVIYGLSGMMNIFNRDLQVELKLAKTFKAVLACLVYQGKMNAILKRISKQLDSLNLDYDHVTLYSFWFNDIAQIACIIRDQYFKRKSTLVVARGHGYDVFAFRNIANIIPYRAWCLNHIDYVFPASENGSQYLRSNYPEYSNKIETRYLGSQDYGVYKYTKNDGFHIVTCSNIIALKRLDLLADTLKLLQDQGIHHIKWTCIGGGDQLTSLMKFASTELKNIEVDFLGRVSNQTVIEFYQHNQVDLFINLSTHEGGLPVSIMEVQSFGIPTIGTDVGGTGEIVINGLTGTLIPTDFSGLILANEINQWINMSSVDYATMRENCRTNWLAKFNADDNYQRFAKRINPNS